ncbi:DMT family transporter [Arhodomonas aquaeolei]|uniref:DMT family transporter n=1 Tax=Arhodomonas TaxID=2368 RepID=UPI0013D0428D|nr:MULTISPECIES: DMT family transporter [Arhodomonas]MCS4503558.1 DMT family transporter [Arhodomonas aquaeolei]
MESATTVHRRGMLIAAAGALVLSFDAVLVRLAATDGWNVAFWRGWGIALSMGLLALVHRERWRPANRREVFAALAAAGLYGMNTALFVLSVSLTRAANTVVILSCAPFFAALFSWLFLGERVRPRTLAAIVVSIAGVAVVFSGSVGGGTLLGDALAMALCVSLGGAFTVLRRCPAVPRIPLTCGSGVVAGLIAWPFADPLTLSASSYGWLAVMGLAQMPLASVLLMTSTRYLPSPEVSLFLLIETVLAPVWVWGAVGEEPPALTLAGAVLVLGAIAVHSWLSLRRVAPLRTTT